MISITILTHIYNSHTKTKKGNCDWSSFYKTQETSLKMNINKAEWFCYEVTWDWRWCWDFLSRHTLQRPLPACPLETRKQKTTKKKITTLQRLSRETFDQTFRFWEKSHVPIQALPREFSNNNPSSFTLLSVNKSALAELSLCFKPLGQVNFRALEQLSFS